MYLTLFCVRYQRHPRMSHSSFAHACRMMTPLRSPSHRLFILPSPFRRWIPAVLGQISLHADSEDDLHAARIGGLHDVSRRNHSRSPLLGQRDSRQRLGSSKGAQGSRTARSKSKPESDDGCVVSRWVLKRTSCGLDSVSLVWWFSAFGGI